MAVESDIVWFGLCDECDWVGTYRVDSESAERELDDHIMECH